MLVFDEYHCNKFHDLFLVACQTFSDCPGNTVGTDLTGQADQFTNIDHGNPFEIQSTDRANDFTLFLHD